MNIATDIGFGSVKSLCNKSLSKYPSAVSLVKRSIFEPSETLYNFNGLNYLVGQDAMRDAYGTRDYIFLEKFAPLLLFKVINDAQLDITQPLRVSTGLSLLNWDKREQFAASLQDFTVNNTRFNNIELFVMPQGKGVLVDCMKQSPELRDELVMVVDIGYNTLDVIPFENGKPLANEAWANTFGVNTMVNELGKYIVSNFGMSLNEAKVNEAFQRGWINCGSRKDLSIIIDEEKQKYVDSVFQVLKSKNSELYNSCDSIIIAGGGAYAFENYTFEDKKVIFPRGEYEFSNVRGYYESMLNG